MDIAWIGIVVALGWTIGGIVGGATGIGAIMVAMPLLTTVLSPSEAVRVSCLVGVYGTVHLAISYRKACRWSDIRDLAIGAVPGCVAGGFILKIAPMDVLQLMVAFLLACFLLLQFFGKAASFRLPDSMLLGVSAGFLCGVVGGSVAMAGAPLGIYVLLKQWDPDKARGNMSAFYLVTSLTVVCTQAAVGLYDARIFQLALVGVLGCAIGTTIGVKIGRKVDRVLFRKVVLLFLAVAAVLLFVRAVG